MEDGQKALDAKIEARVQELKEDQKALDTRIDRVEEGLRKDIKDLDPKIDTKMDKPGGKIDRILYIIAGAAVAVLIGGMLRMFVKWEARVEQNQTTEISGASRFLLL